MVLDIEFFVFEQAYEMLSILEGTSMMAQQAMQKGSKLKHEDSHNLDFYFDKAGFPSICWVPPLHSVCVRESVQ